VRLVDSAFPMRLRLSHRLTKLCAGPDGTASTWCFLVRNRRAGADRWSLVTLADPHPSAGLSFPWIEEDSRARPVSVRTGEATVRQGRVMGFRTKALTEEPRLNVQIPRSSSWGASIAQHSRRCRARSRDPIPAPGGGSARYPRPVPLGCRRRRCIRSPLEQRL
jgi:hypothetical protein